MQYTVNDIAKMIDHSLLQPVLTDVELEAGCQLAKEYNVAAVCIKPYAVKMAKELLAGSDVQVCTVVGFPHGSSTIQSKVFETRQACKEGATEIDMVVNIGKALSEDWRYIKKEMAAILKECHKHGAILKVIFENDFMPKDRLIAKLSKISSIVGVEFIKTSTGYGYTKQPDGSYNYKGATLHDVANMRKNASANVQIKSAGGVRTLDDLLKHRELGVTRIGATATVAMVEEAKKRLGLATNPNAPTSAPAGY